jgi:hypothetical protein
VPPDHDEAARGRIELPIPNSWISKLGYPIPIQNQGVDMPSMHDFEALSITGEPIRLSEFEGQLCLVVNVASR